MESSRLRNDYGFKSCFKFIFNFSMSFNLVHELVFIFVLLGLRLIPVIFLDLKEL